MVSDVRYDGSSPAFFWIVFLIITVFAFAGIAVWIWALVDCIRVPDDRYYRSGTKLVWVLVIALLQVIGAIVYLVAGRPDRATRDGWGTGTSSTGGGVSPDPTPRADAGPTAMPPPPPPSA